LRKSGRRAFLRELGSLVALPALPGARALAQPVHPDVCVVGSGPAGMLLACRLVESGASVVVVESGPVGPASSETGSTAFRSDAAPGPYPLERTRFRGPGGTSNLWGGGASRLRPRDLDGWPIAGDALEPYYAQAEAELRVASPPAPDDARLAGLAGRLGVASVVPPISAPSEEPGLRVASSHLPRLANSPLARFESGLAVTRIEARAGRVASLEAREVATGAVRRIAARDFVLATGGVEAPRLLLASGVGPTDRVGRGFMEHLFVELGGIALDGPPFTAPAQRLSWQLHGEWTAEGSNAVVLEIEARPPRTLALSAVVEMKPHPANRISLDPARQDALGVPLPRVDLRLDARTLAAVARLDAFARERLGRLGRFEAPAEPRFAWCHHHMGACRMAKDAADGVVDPDLRVHGLENLYVAGSAAFVGCGVASPTLLIAALSLRLGDRLSGRAQS
jgi:choline dehydrogenase-like flavoprotein